MKEHYDFSKGRKNPYAEIIHTEGYSITIHYSPKDVSDGSINDIKDIIRALLELMPVEDASRLLAHISNNFELPCSPDIRETIRILTNTKAG